MNERTQISVGSALLIVGAAVVLLFALPSLAVPVALAGLAALAMAAGTLLVGTSSETV